MLSIQRVLYTIKGENTAMKRIYNIKKTISVKQFIAEFGENFTEHMKQRLLDLEVRTVLTRKDINNRVDIKHVEHTRYETLADDSITKVEKEYSYGELAVIDGLLYFSNSCIVNNDLMQSPIVDKIYSHLQSEEILTDYDIAAKKVDDSNIDYVIDSILEACPEVSQRYMDIVKGMIDRSKK